MVGPKESEGKRRSIRLLRGQKSPSCHCCGESVLHLICFGKMKGVVEKNSNSGKAWPPEAIERAKEIQANLSPEHPSFIKVLRKSHVSGCYYMCIPPKFGKQHLPVGEAIVTFEVLSRKSYNVKSLGEGNAFSGGFKGFSIAENLQENDVLVFQLVGPCRFKVYIVRENGSALVDKAPIVVEGDNCLMQEEAERKRSCERDQKRLKLIPERISQDNVEVGNSSTKSLPCPDNSNSSNVGDFQPSEVSHDFMNFKIVVDGTIIEIPQKVQEDYFKLCYGQKSYLHRHLIKGIDHELAASIISGTVNISIAIRESTIFTPEEDIAYWRKALDGFEIFGMNVGFIRLRLNRLSGLTLDIKRYKEAEIERDRVADQISELQKAERRLSQEIEGMKEEFVKREATYKEEANAPWCL